ncbi:eukaryotic translation initiation factor 2-alpha kinase, partial [Coemansia spiralis]
MPSNVLVVKESPGKFVAKLFNTSYREELLALHRATPLSAAIGDAVGTDTRVAPEVVDRPDMMGRKNDIWCVGVIGLQMVLGMDALRGVPIGGEPQVLAAHRSAMPPALFDLLARMLTADHRVRPTAIDALDSPLFYQGPNVHRQALDSASRVLTLDPRNVEGERPQRPSRVERALRPSTSRYRTDFEEVGFLGKGGFGSVVKARNRIDGRFYAIKKIPLDPRDSDSNKKIFREVTTLSRLHHHHVVRYYTTWVENVDVVDYDSDSDDGSDDSSAAGDGFGAHLSHSSWSTEGDPEAESGYSSSESKGTGGDNHGSTSGSGALDEPHSHAAMLARPAGSRTDVFSAIRFGTMGSGSSAAHKRAVPSGPVREFAIESTDSQSDSQASEVATESDSALRNMLRRDQLKYDRERQTTHQSRLRKRDTRRQILYIQMEYCENKTLSDLLREGIDEKTCWRLFAQILEGLKHIHQCGVIHRDLKPVNAFLDAAGEVKIGDFGLATSSFAQIDPGLRHLSLDRSVEDGLTADIGTAMYVAPEATAAMSGGNTMRYNQKVDMYSLGIIFFEMCYPMGTGMERATVLHGLRKPEIVFPADFDVDRMQLQHQIIRQLLSHSPRQRPSSAELLESGLLPPRVEDGHIHETIRAIANPAQPHFSKLMDALFVQAADKHIDATFDFRAGDVQAEQLNSVFLDRIRELMTRVFRTHAAVELSTPAVMPHADLLGVHHRPATYVDPRGTVVQLAYDQTAPFARYVARTRMTEIKRYCFGRCFAANAAGGQPVSHSTASFDAVTTRSVHAVAAGEVVSVACEVFNELPAFRGVPTVLLVNHMSVLDAVLAYCGILHPEWTAGEDARPDDSQRHAQFVRSVCDCLSAAVHREKAPAVRQRIQIMAATMGVRVHSQTLDRLQQFLAIRGDIGAIQREVLARIGSACGVAGTRYATAGAAYVQAAIQAFGELRQVETSVRQFGAAVPVACVPLFSLNYAYYRGGYAFQLMTDRPAARRQQPQVLAAGGRCDGLLRHFRHLADEGLGDSARDVVCVGVQIPLDMVVEEMALYQQQVLSVAAPATPTFGLWTRKRCDVVVASFGAHPMLRQ